MAYDIGPRIGIEGEKEFRNAIQGINTNLKTLGTEMLAVTSQFDKNDKSMESLTSSNKVLNKQIDEQKNKLSELQKGLQTAAEKYGENDKVTQGWQQAVNKATADLNKMERELKNNQSEIDNFGKEIKDTSVETDKFSDKLKGLGSGLVNVGKVASSAVITGIKAMGAAIVGAGAGIIGITESTKEYRNDLSKLEQNAKGSGNSFDVMKDQLSGLNALTGETDSSIESLSNLMATGLDDNQMAQAIDALSGAVIKFPDTLKIEGLADGLQETLATGEAIGPFAELIDRMGGSTEEFNSALAGATTEAEKQQVALDWLAKSGLAEVNSEYEKANKGMLSAAEAQFKLNDSMANFATAVEPTIATMKGGLAEILSSLVGVVIGTDGATEDFVESIKKFAENTLSTISTMIPTIAVTFQTLIPALVEGITEVLPSIADAGIDIMLTLVTSVVDVLPELILVAVNIIMTLVSGIIDALPTLVDSATEMIDSLVAGLIDLLPELIPAAIEIIIAIANGLIGALPKLIERIPEIIIAIFNGLVVGIPQILEFIPQLFTSLLNVVTNTDWAKMGENIVEGLWNGISSLADWIKGKVEGFVEGIGNTIKEFFGIASPSKLMEGYGRYIDEGLAVGIEGNADKPLSAMNKVANSINSTIQTITDAANAAVEAVKSLASAETMSKIKKADSKSSSARIESQSKYQQEKKDFENAYAREISAYSKMYDVDKGVAAEILKKDLKIPKYATGTQNHPGGLALVGEKGAELLNLPKGTQVFNNQETERMIRPRPLTLNLNIGTLIADDYGLKQLERKMRNIRIDENLRLGVPG